MQTATQSNLRIHKNKGKRIGAPMYARTLYKAIVGYEQFQKCPDGFGHEWVAIEETVFVSAWNLEDAHTEAFKTINNCFNPEVKSVAELSQAEYMRFIGVPELFLLAA